MEDYLKIFENALEKNKEETTKWTSFLDEYTQLNKNLREFQKHTSVEIMVPVVTNKALLPGKLYHTSEISISHGNNLYSSCTTLQALNICDHRTKAAKERLAQLKEENQLLRNKIELPFDESAFATSNEQEIIEMYDEEEEKQWREKHRASIKNMKKQEANARTDKTKAEGNIFDKLDELEMIEELENELENLEVEPTTNEVADIIKNLMNEEVKEKPRKSHINKDGEIQFKSIPIGNAVQKPYETKPLNEYDDLGDEYVVRNEIIKLESQTKSCNIPDRIAFLSAQLKNVTKEIEALRYDTNVTEASLLKRADLEEIKDYLEEQLDKLQSDSEEDDQPAAPTVRRRSSVSFAENNSVHIIDSTDQPSEMLSQKTLKLKITHCANAPNHQSTASTTDEISSPSDIYVKFAHCFYGSHSKKSILKNKEKVQEENINRKYPDQQEGRAMSKRAKQMEINEAVAFGEVVERSAEEKDAMPIVQSKPGSKVSRFKQSRRK